MSRVLTDSLQSLEEEKEQGEKGMIAYEPDGITLFYTDAAGSTISASPMQPQYVTFYTILNAQHQAQIDNTQAQSQYLEQLHDYQTNLNAGRPMGNPPAVPLMKVVDDATGNVSMIPFLPSLPTPVPPAPAVSSDGAIKNNNPAPDRTDVLISLVSNLTAIVNQIKAKVGA